MLNGQQKKGSELSFLYIRNSLQLDRDYYLEYL